MAKTSGVVELSGTAPHGGLRVPLTGEIADEQWRSAVAAGLASSCGSKE
ncbi:hypothetical protein [Streptomyces sp. NPDC001816]